MDSSVLIAFLARDDVHHRAARAAIEELEDSPVVPVIAYAEVMVGAFRASERGRRKVEAFFDTVRIQPLTRPIARRGATLRARTGASLPDALVVATAQEIGAAKILTADDRWRALDRRVRVVGRHPRS